jgi:hypothetical protein
MMLTREGAKRKRWCRRTPRQQQRVLDGFRPHASSLHGGLEENRNFARADPCGREAPQVKSRAGGVNGRLRWCSEDFECRGIRPPERVHDKLNDEGASFLAPRNESIRRRPRPRS